LDIAELVPRILTNT